MHAEKDGEACAGPRFMEVVSCFHREIKIKFKNIFPPFSSSIKLTEIQHCLQKYFPEILTHFEITTKNAKYFIVLNPAYEEVQWSVIVT